MDASFYDELVARITQKSEIPEEAAQAPAAQNNQAVADDTLTASPQQIL